MANRKGDYFVSHLALILSVVTIILAWSAFRSTDDNDTKLHEIDTQLKEERIEEFSLQAQDEVSSIG